MATTYTVTKIIRLEADVKCEACDFEYTFTTFQVFKGVSSGSSAGATQLADERITQQILKYREGDYSNLGYGLPCPNCGYVQSWMTDEWSRQLEHDDRIPLWPIYILFILMIVMIVMGVNPNPNPILAGFVGLGFILGFFSYAFYWLLSRGYKFFNRRNKNRFWYAQNTRSDPPTRSPTRVTMTSYKQPKGTWDIHIYSDLQESAESQNRAMKNVGVSWHASSEKTVIVELEPGSAWLDFYLAVGKAYAMINESEEAVSIICDARNYKYGPYVNSLDQFSEKPPQVKSVIIIRPKNPIASILDAPKAAFSFIAHAKPEKDKRVRKVRTMKRAMALLSKSSNREVSAVSG